MSNTERAGDEALYHRLVCLREEMPWDDLRRPACTRWLGRAIAVVEESGCTAELVTLRTEIAGLFRPSLYAGVPLLDTTPHAIAVAIDTVIAKVELRLPVQAQGAFIPTGGVHDAFQAIATAVRPAKSDVLFVDPYADEKIIGEFATLVPEHVQVRVLADASRPQPSLKPAAERWIAQHPTRPLQVRRAAARALHDRLIVVDEKIAWAVGQSFKDLVNRSPSSLLRVDPETAALKVSAYKAIWDASTPVA